MWDHLNELIGCETCNNKLPTDLNANAVNGFFINLGPSIVASVPASKYHHNTFEHHVSHAFFMSEIFAVD